MKRLLILFLALLLLAVIPASAQEDEMMTGPLALAEYAPAEAVVFASVNTSDDFIETANGLIAEYAGRIAEATGEPVDEVDVRDLFTDGDDADDFSAWLGESAAVIVPSVNVLLNDPNTALVGLLEVDDFEAALDYYADLYAFNVEQGDYVVIEQEDGSVLYEAQVSFISSVLITEEVAVFGTIDDVLLPGADARRLSDDETFNQTINALPEDAYNALVYINPQGGFTLAQQLLPLFLGSDMPEDLDLEAVGEAVGSQALGFTLLGERTLAMDYAQFGATTDLAEDPLDLAMLDYVPADAAFVIEAQGLGATLSGALAALYELDAFLVESNLTPPEAQQVLGFVGPGDLATFITLSLEGTYGIDLDETLQWLNGDFVLYLRPVLTETSPLGGAVETGWVVNTDNPEATAELVEATADLAQRQFDPATFEDDTLTVPFGAVVSLPEFSPLVMTATDDVFAVGTGDTVERALDPDDTVTDTDAYAFESDLFLDDPSLLFYISVEPLREFTLTLLEDSGMVNEDDLEAASALLNLLDSAAVTTSRAERISTARFTLTLGE